MNLDKNKIIIPKWAVIGNYWYSPVEKSNNWINRKSSNWINRKSSDWINRKSIEIKPCVKINPGGNKF